jgi:hypothetical protein
MFLQAKAKKKIIELPIPAVTNVADYAQFTKSGYQLPVAFHRREIKPSTEVSEYDLDYEDEVSVLCMCSLSHEYVHGRRANSAFDAYIYSIDLVDCRCGSLTTNDMAPRCLSLIN